MKLSWSAGQDMRILDLDSESRPLSFWYDDKTTADITAIAWCWVGQKRVHVELLDSDPQSQVRMLEAFLEVYRKADCVTAHNLRGFDLPLLQGALAEHKLDLLEPKLASDTLRDCPKWKDLPKSQEFLCEMLGIEAEKKHMSQASWRSANRLADGRRKTHKRVHDDILQHLALREKLLSLGWLKPPRVWHG